jgi:hypothetical protein
MVAPSRGARGFGGESVEVDAIPPLALRELARTAIAAHVDSAQLDVILAAEKSERQIAREIAGSLGNG